MIEVLTILGVIAAIAVAGVLLLAALKPGTFSVQRSLVIEAPAERVFPLISNVRTMNAWNPFAKEHPADAITYSGPETGVGAAYDWDIPGRAGAGHIEVTSAVPPSSIDMDLVMHRPFRGTNKIRFSIAPTGTGSTVTWALSGPWPYLHRVMGTIFSMDKMVGGTFEKGLQSLKAMAEAR